MARTARFDRQVALHRAVELFWSRGYYASSMKHIEEALDMRPGSLYATFGSKSGLFSEALDAYAARGRDEFAQIVDRAPSVIEGLQGYLQTLAYRCMSTAHAPVQACLLVKTLLEVNAEDAVLLAKAEALLAQIEARLHAALTRAKAAGELRADVDCRRLARLLQAQIMGLRAFATRDVPDAQIAALADDMANLLDSFRSPAG